MPPGRLFLDPHAPSPSPPSVGALLGDDRSPKSVASLSLLSFCSSDVGRQVGWTRQSEPPETQLEGWDVTRERRCSGSEDLFVDWAD